MGEGVGQPRKGDGDAAQGAGDFLGAPLGAVGDGDFTDAGVGEGAGHQAAGVAGADDQGAAVVQAVVEAAGQVHGGAAYGTGMAADIGIPMHAPPGAEGLVEHAGQRAFDITGLAGGAECRPHLAQDLPLADNH